MRALFLSTAALIAAPALAQTADTAAPPPAQSTAALAEAGSSGQEITVTASRTAEPVALERAAEAHDRVDAGVRERVLLAP